MKFEHALNRHYRKRKPEEKRSCIAHKYLCGVFVERHEPYARCGEYCGYHCRMKISVEKNHAEKRCRRYRRNAAGKSVKPVDKIYRVCQSDNPKNRYRNTPNSEHYIVSADAYMVYDHAVHNGDHGSSDLNHEFQHCRQSENIIKYSDCDKDKTAEPYRKKLFCRIAEDHR